ncbi:MAG: hypothetical protein ACREGC_03215 [Minisyncoccia bacterium]
MDQFLLALNPMHQDDETGFCIIHTKDPIAIIQCKPVHEQTSHIFEQIEFTNRQDKIEKWILSVYHFFTTDFLEKPEDRAVGILNQACCWFKVYMEWEGNRFNKDGEIKL